MRVPGQECPRRFELSPIRLPASLCAHALYMKWFARVFCFVTTPTSGKPDNNNITLLCAEVLLLWLGRNGVALNMNDLTFLVAVGSLLVEWL